MKTKTRRRRRPLPLWEIVTLDGSPSPGQFEKFGDPETAKVWLDTLAYRYSIQNNSVTRVELEKQPDKSYLVHIKINADKEDEVVIDYILRQEVLGDASKN